MANRLLRILGSASLTASLAAASVQVRAGEIKFRIPFNFVVNGEPLPPGTYDVTCEGSVLLVRGYSHGAGVVTIRTESLPPRGPSLVFNRHGDRYVLVEAWMGSSGRLLPASRGERELTAGRSSSGKRVDRIVVPAR
jgi:hypothetical protein